MTKSATGGNGFSLAAEAARDKTIVVGCVGRGRHDGHGCSWLMFETLFENEDLIAVNKPEGLSAIPERQPDPPPAESLFEIALCPAGREALHRPPDRQGHQRRDHLRAKAPRPTASWAVQFERRLVAARCIWPWSTAWSPPRRARSTSRSASSAPAGSPSTRSTAAPPYTEYLVLHRFTAYTLVEAYPKTGRRHQIRVHLYSIGHPIVGDRLYGDRTIQRPVPPHDAPRPAS